MIQFYIGLKGLILPDLLLYKRCVALTANGLQLPEGREFENEISLKE